MTEARTEEIDLSSLEELLLASLPVCVLVGPEHTFVVANPPFMRLFPDRPLTGRSFRDAFPELVHTELSWVLDDVLASGEPATVGEVEARGERLGAPCDVFVAFHVRPIRRAGRVAGLLAVATDVTAQVEARRRIEALELRSAFLAEASAAMGATLEPREALELAAQLAVQHFADWCCIDVVVEDDLLRGGAAAAARPEVEAALRELARDYPPRPGDGALAGRALAADEPMLLADCDAGPPFARPRDERQRRLLERVAPRSAMSVPLRARGVTLGVMTLAWVQARTQYTVEDMALAEELTRHAALAVDNARLYHAAQAGIQVREEFLAIAGHELKTPLTALKLNVQSLVRAAGRAPPPALNQLVDRLAKMTRQTARLERLVNEFLDVSRVTAGRLILAPEEIDLRALVVEALARVEDDLAEAGSRAALDAPQPVLGRWDPARLDQVVTNLVSNAIKYGQGRPIEVWLRRAGECVELGVRDHGIGIAEEKQASIFGRFERAVSERHYGGFGLGLWIVREIVAASGGSIRFASTPGQGSTFIVELPLRSAEGDPGSRHA